MEELYLPAAAGTERAGLAARLNAGPFVFGGLAVLGLGAANGGYFPTSWGWASLAFAAVLVWSLALRAAVRPSALELFYLAGLLAVVCWFALSSVWGTPSSAVEEAVRALVYATGASAAWVLVRRGAAPALLAGVLAGSSAVAAYSLATRLFPDRIGSFDSFAGYRLAAPIGYWNALGLFSAIALLLVLALAAYAGSPLRAALAAAPAPVLLAVLYFTFGRGAWISLGFGLALALLLDPLRLRLTATAIVLGAPTAAGVLVASRSSALAKQQASVARAAHDGHRLALLILGLVLLSSALAAILTILRRHVLLPASVARASAVLFAVVALAAVAVALVRLGGPTHAVHRAWHAFVAPSPQTGGDLRKRLFSFSGSGRIVTFRVAWRDAKAHPLIGSGAGSYEAYWLAHRPVASKVRDAHSLYLETFAELGAIGLVLLLLALGTPLAAAVRARKRPGVAAAAGPYGAYLVGAGADWDWEITSVTLMALMAGVAILAAARPDEEREAPAKLRYGILVGALAVGVVGFVFLVGNMFLFRAKTAAAAGHWRTAASDARRASFWLPWATQPWQQLGEVQLDQGQVAAAQTSLRTAIRMDSGDWNLWFDLARASTGNQQTVALANATRLNSLSPEIAEFKNELGSQSGISIAATPVKP